MSTASSSSLQDPPPSVTAGTPQSLVDTGCVPHDPLLYRPDFVWPDTADSEPYLPFRLENENESYMQQLVQQYQRDGFLVIPHALSTLFHTPVAIESVQQAVDHLISGKNEAFAQAIRDRMANHKDPPDFTSGAKIPWIQYEAGTLMDISTSDAEILLTPSSAPRVRKIMGFTGGYDPTIDAIVSDPHLLSLVARLLHCRHDDEIQLFQDMALLKPPHGGREKPWHQDKAYFNVALDEPVVGLWMALDSATLGNGCLRFARGGQMHGPQPHVPLRDYQMQDAAAKQRRGRVVAVPLPPGGLVLFDGLIPHGTPTNDDPWPRRALQFHWIRKNAQFITTAERAAAFSKNDT